METRTTKGVNQEELIRWAREQMANELSVAEGCQTEAMKAHHYGVMVGYREMCAHVTGYTIRSYPPPG